MRRNTKLERFTASHPDTSWFMEPVEGTGLRYWRFTVTTQPEWQGDTKTFEGKTIAETLDLADRWFLKIQAMTTELDTLTTNLYFWRNQRNTADECVRRIEAEIAKAAKIPDDFKITGGERRMLRRVECHRITFYELSKGEQRIAFALSHMKLIHEKNIDNKVVLSLTDQGRAVLDLNK